MVEPCPLCGYDAPRLDPAAGISCPHCRLEPWEESLRPRLRGPWIGVMAGLAALPRGLYYLFDTPGVKRWLVPPLLLTLGAFAGLFWWLWSLLRPVIHAIETGSREHLPWDAGWTRRAAEWLMDRTAVLWLAQLGVLLLSLVVAAVAAAWAFSVVYEALSGPFLDEVHGRIEQRWFGANPRDLIQRPTSLSPRACGLWTAAASAPALAAVAGWWILDGPWAWALLLLGAPLPYVAAGLLNREYGRWLWWILRLEGGTLWVSIKASLVAFAVLVLFFWLKFVPVIGYPLFFCVAGFTTAITLLDIPFSRRQWSLDARLSFLGRNLPAVVAFGIVASFLFVLPILGPVLMVPASSIGGLWLLCRLDKDFLRSPEARIGPRRALPAASPWDAARPVQIEHERPPGPQP